MPLEEIGVTSASGKARRKLPLSGRYMKRIARAIVDRAIRSLKSIRMFHPLASRAFQIWYEIPFPPTHYYSPLPDMHLVKRNLGRWYREADLTGVRMDADEQLGLLEKLKAYSPESNSLTNFAQISAEGFGLGYGEVEAHLLHCMIRHLKPHRIVEVGSGVSTYFALNALEKNYQADGIGSTMVCVEPYPTPKLRQLAAQNRITLHRKQVQDVAPGLFREMDEGDILFIDSSHVTKVDSDVNFLYLEVLQKLRKGVMIHVHDIAFPFPTCPPEHPMFNHSVFWNESALVRAFLTWNTAFDIVMCQSYLHYKFPESIQKVVKIYDKRRHFPSSLWFAKTK